jgi:hypothetical protein
MRVSGLSVAKLTAALSISRQPANKLLLEYRAVNP